jgi:hypothetical protein
MSNPSLNLVQTAIHNPTGVNMKEIIEEIIEDALSMIVSASSERLAEFLSGRQCLFLDHYYETHILPVDAETDGAFRQAYGLLYDLAVSPMESIDYGDETLETLSAAVEIVGMPEGYEELEELDEDGHSDSIRKKAMDASPEFMQNCRDYVKNLIKPKYILQIVEQLLDDQEEARNAASF